jgi:hypothetical protein
MKSCQIKLAGELAWARAGGSRGADRDRGILDPTQFSPSLDLFLSSPPFLTQRYHPPSASVSVITLQARPRVASSIPLTRPHILT